MPDKLDADRKLLLALFVVDAIVLALLEVFWLPLRFDGTLLPNLGGFPLPVTVVLGAISTPWLVSTTGKLVKPGLSWVPLVVWVLVVLGFGTLGPGGDQVLILDWRALLLLGASALPAAMVVGGGLGRAATGRTSRG